MRVLLVEDSQILLRTVRRVLRHAGFAVDTAADGEEGLPAAELNDYDVLVLDIMLPKLNVLAFSDSVTASFLLRARMPLHNRTSDTLRCAQVSGTTPVTGFHQVSLFVLCLATGNKMHLRFQFAASRRVPGAPLKIFHGHHLPIMFVHAKVFSDGPFSPARIKTNKTTKMERYTANENTIERKRIR